MSIQSIKKFFSNVDRYIMENATDWKSPAGLVALIPIVSLIYKVRMIKPLEQELRQESDYIDRISASERYENLELHFNRCAVVEAFALAILFPLSQPILAVRASLMSGLFYGMYKSFQLRNRTVFDSGNVFIFRMARHLR